MSTSASRWTAALPEGVLVLHEGASAWVDAVCRRVEGLALPASATACLAVASGVAQAGRNVVVDLPGSARLSALRASMSLPFSGAGVVLRVPWGSHLVWLDAPCIGLLADAGVRVVVPSSLDALQDCVAAAFTRPGLTVVLEHRALADAEPAAAAPADVAAAVAVCLLHLGPAHACYEAVEALAAEGIAAGVVDAGELPLSGQAIGAVQRHGRPVFVCSDPSAGPPALAALAASDAFWHLHAQPRWAPAETEAIVAAAKRAAADLQGVV